ncbi:unnamed protein product, partial [Ectocarpus sp. 4 AP-2014]
MDAGLEELDLQGYEEATDGSMRAATAVASTLLQSGTPP